MVIPDTRSARNRLALHGLSAEMLHGLLVQEKKHQAKNMAQLAL